MKSSTLKRNSITVVKKKKKGRWGKVDLKDRLHKKVKKNMQSTFVKI